MKKKKVFTNNGSNADVDLLVKFKKYLKFLFPVYVALIFKFKAWKKQKKTKTLPILKGPPPQNLVFQFWGWGSLLPSADQRFFKDIKWQSDILETKLTRTWGETPPNWKTRFRGGGPFKIGQGGGFFLMTWTWR